MNEKGRLRLWINPTSTGAIPSGSYTVGADIAHGTGASNSVLSVVDNKTGEKVAEFASAHIRPDELARYAIALCYWFCGAFLIWEANGPGRIFGDVVIKSGYRNIYYREKGDGKSVGASYTDIPGYFSTTESRLSLLGDYRRSLKEGTFINRSRESLDESLKYVFLPNGNVQHVDSTREEDPTGARENHGDRVIADALAWKGIQRGFKKEEPDPVVPVGSFMYRRLERKRNKQQGRYSWRDHGYQR